MMSLILCCCCLLAPAAVCLHFDGLQEWAILLGPSLHLAAIFNKCGEIAVYRNDSRVNYLKEKCGGVITVSYNDEGSSRGGRIIDKLGKGLMLNWTAYNCTDCLTSGGQCGFDDRYSQFNCYCPDRTHALHCVVPFSQTYKKKSGLILGNQLSSFKLHSICWWETRNIYFTNICLDFLMSNCRTQSIFAYQ
ncbi:uncharacterized protein [Spinacia oleracea]|uniref:Wall-associated receptor kinase C-terminal domain-containing protein n=1 Tax=Spinacia oleracea TaxID=3562 RepID=A0A9R0JFX3_SPIOL|nr:uncharacterized protein LOC110805783 [Spinacia oleracea]